MSTAPTQDDITGGTVVEVREVQRLPDGTTFQPGERGEVLYHSSQAACWVVHFAERAVTKVLPGVVLDVVKD